MATAKEPGKSSHVQGNVRPGGRPSTRPCGTRPPVDVEDKLRRGAHKPITDKDLFSLSQHGNVLVII